MPQLALVHSAASPAVHPRPFATYYYGPGSPIHQWSHRGRAASLRGAAIAALKHLVDRRAVKALIHDEDGVVVARLTRARGRISIIGV